MAKLGFRPEGLRPRYLHIDGDWRDHLVFALNAEEVPEGLLRRWENLRGADPTRTRRRRRRVDICCRRHTAQDHEAGTPAAAYGLGVGTTGVIFAAIAIAWLAYLVPHFVRRRDDEPVDEADPADRFADSMRIVRHGTAPLLDQDLEPRSRRSRSPPRRPGGPRSMIFGGWSGWRRPGGGGCCSA